MRYVIIVVLTALVIWCCTPDYPKYEPSNIGEEISYMLRIEKETRRVAAKFHIPYSLVMSKYCFYTAFGKKKNILPMDKYVVKHILPYGKNINQWCQEDPRICGFIDAYNLSVSDEFR